MSCYCAVLFFVNSNTLAYFVSIKVGSMEKNTSIIIGSRVIGFENIRWQDLEFLQDDNFKEWINDGDVKLMQSLVKYQFIDPFKVWEDGNKLYCLEVVMSS